MPNKPKGRPKKYAKYDELRNSLAVGTSKRPKYVGGIGWYQGKQGEKVFLKILLRHGGSFNGKHHPKGFKLEIPLGDASSWSYEQLEDRRRELQGKADRGEPLEETEAPTFADWANGWVAGTKGRLRSYKLVERQVRLQFNPTFGTHLLTAITVQNVNSWITMRLAEVKPATVKRELSTLTTILNDAIKSGLLEANPCANADKIKGVVGRQRFLSPEEMVILLIEAGKVADWLPDFILWGIHSGMRKSEMLGIQWGDIAEFENGRTIVTLEKTKSDQPRQIICTDTMVGILAHQKKRKSKGNQAVFPVSKMTLRRRWEKARKAADVSDVTMHDLRRTNATYAAAAGVDLKTLADRLGHSNLTMLEKRYAALVGTAQVAAAEKIEEAMATVIASTNPA
jgi:integrase